MDDFHRMGLIRREAYPIAEKISQSELREVLFFRHASQGNQKRNSSCAPWPAKPAALIKPLRRLSVPRQVAFSPV